MVSFNENTIPPELTARKQWVCWAYEKKKDGTLTKVLKRSRTGTNAASTDPTSWSTFADAVMGCKRFGMAGIGFVFAEDRAITGLDLDHVLVDGIIDEEYRWIVEATDTYTEISPSGNGLHLFFLGGKPDGADRCRKGPLEMYDQGRFFTVTGNLYTDPNGTIHEDLREAPDVLAAVYDKYLADKRPAGTTPKATNSVSTVSLDDQQVIDKMLSSKSGSRIRALMDGDLTAYNDDHSAADQALCNHLAYWTGKDAAQMDRIFRTTGLMRDKWDSRRGSTTYGQGTIDNAIAYTTDTYCPPESGEVQNDGALAWDDTISESTDEITVSAPTEALVQPAPLSVGKWKIEDGKLYIVTVSKDGTETKTPVTSTPPCIVADLHDVERGTIRALVALNINGTMTEVALDRDTLLSNTKIVGALAPLRANISTSNASEVVNYLTACDGLMPRPTYESMTHMGWVMPLGPFLPYDAGTSPVRFDPMSDTRALAASFMEPKGTLEAWVAGIAPIREMSTAFRAVLAASFAAPLVSVLGVQPFAVYLWGLSGTGKTPTLKAAGSVWGDPTERANSYYGTFADTHNYIIRKSTVLGNLPILIDELQSKRVSGQADKRQSVENQLYELSLGHERGRSNTNGTAMESGSWQSITIATGEIPILGDSTQQGALNRTLEINAEPIPDKRVAQHLHHLVAKQHGTAGRAYIEYLKSYDLEFYWDTWVRMRDEVVELAPDNPQADNIALLALADALAGCAIFNKAWADAADDAIAFARELAKLTQTVEERDTDRKAIIFVSNWIASNPAHFTDKDSETTPYELYGVREHLGDDVTIYVIASNFKRAVEAAGFEETKTLRRMRKEGIIKTSGGEGLKYSKRIPSNGPTTRTVAIIMKKLDEFLSGTDEGDVDDD